MKSLFYLLLLANLTFFLWERFVRLEPGGAEPAGRMERRVDAILLLKELPPPPISVRMSEEIAGTPPGQTDAPAAGAVKPAETRNLCARLGPFDTEAEAMESGRGIAGDARVESRPGAAESGYWVLHPPAASFEEARAVKRKLMEQGVKETLILREGENANAVSLGFFRDRTRAESLARAYRAKGIDSLEIHARRDGKARYWLNIRADAAEAASWNASRQRLGELRPDLRVEENAGCGEGGAGGNH